METGTFKRNGEGDYVCRLPEVAAMLRDNSDISYDSTLLEGTSFEDIDLDSFHSYRNRLAVYLPNHPWNSDNDEMFAEMIGALSIEHDKKCLTVAGLLMFGKEHRIYRYFPNFKLDYKEYTRSDTSWDYRIVSGSGLWVGNLYNFFNRTMERLMVRINSPLVIELDGQRIEDTDQHRAVRECVLNSLIHADYCGSVTVDIGYSPSGISVVNSGLFRIPLDKAEHGGDSDPRNKTLSKMFGLIGFVERAGLGVRYIREVWKSKWGVYPTIIEDVDGQKVIVKLPTVCDEPLSDTESSILSLLMDDPHLSIVRISKTLGVSVGVVSNSLNNMRSIGIIERIGGTRGYWAINPKKRQ
ncbi:MAG: winged helix-turn-helix transcriptional regulator [archaeon]|nr:winged helix-turn-helix transcriptional regulator [archaeon]